MKRQVHQAPPTRSELVTKMEELTETRKAIVERMASHSLPIDTGSFRSLVKKKQDLTIEIESIRAAIRDMDYKATHPEGFPGPTMRNSINQHNTNQ